MRHIKPRLLAHGGAANPRDSTAAAIKQGIALITAMLARADAYQRADHLLHHRSRLGLWLCRCARHQTGHQQRLV